MLTFIWGCVIASFVLIISAAPSIDRRGPSGPTWFDILTYLTQSQKQKTRVQQTHRHGSRRY
jgi:hypothetical protein